MSTLSWLRPGSEQAEGDVMKDLLGPRGDVLFTWALVLLGLLPVVLVLVQRAPWSFDASIGLLLSVLGLRELRLLRKTAR
jgi:hypothetical protein